MTDVAEAISNILLRIRESRKRKIRADLIESIPSVQTQFSLHEIQVQSEERLQFATLHDIRMQIWL